MADIDVPPAEWADFLDSFSRRHRGWLVSVSQSDTAGTSRAGEYRPLAAVTPERDGARVSAIAIAFAADSGAPVVRIDRPSTVRVERTTEGAERALEIVDAQQLRTRLDFRAAATSDMLDGVAPAEI
jgi:hypothetical protein